MIQPNFIISPYFLHPFDAFYSSRARNVSGSGVGDGAAGTLLCRLSYLPGLCTDMDIELNGGGNEVPLPVSLFFVMCDVLT